MNETITSPVESVCAPVSKSAPAGQWVRYEPEFDALKAEVDRLSIDPNNVDWDKIVSLASDILTKQSKDLLVSSYLTVALFQRDGFLGLDAGLEMLETLTANFWDSLFPEAKKKKARASAIGWLVDRIAAGVDPEQASATDQAVIEGSVERLTRLDTFLDVNLGDQAPTLGPLTRRLKEVVQHIDAAAAAEAKRKAAAEAKGEREQAAKLAAQALDVSTPENAERSLGPLLKKFGAAGRQLRTKAPSDPRAYRLPRIAAWLPMVSIPSHTEGRVGFELEDFSPDLLQGFKDMAARRAWLEVIEAAEAQFEKSVLWLDPQRIACEALEQLGDDYAGARSAIVGEVTSLVSRFPELVELEFANAVPFASERTKAWLASEAAGRGRGRTVPFGSTQGSDEELDEALVEARDMLQKQQLAEAVGRLGQIVDRGSGARMTFMRRLAMARFLVDAQQHRLAIAQLQDLDDRLKHFDLEEWDPALALEVLRLFLECQNRMLANEWKSMPEAGRRAQELLSRLARLDPGVALGMQ